jgi:hypothetical protein
MPSESRPERSRLFGCQLGNLLHVPFRLENEPATQHAGTDGVIEDPSSLSEDGAARRFESPFQHVTSHAPFHALILSSGAHFTKPSQEDLAE